MTKAGKEDFPMSPWEKNLEKSELAFQRSVNGLRYMSFGKLLVTVQT